VCHHVDPAPRDTVVSLAQGAEAQELDRKGDSRDRILFEVRR